MLHWHVRYVRIECDSLNWVIMYAVNPILISTLDACSTLLQMKFGSVMMVDLVFEFLHFLGYFIFCIMLFISRTTLEPMLFIEMCFKNHLTVKKTGSLSYSALFVCHLSVYVCTYSVFSVSLDSLVGFLFISIFQSAPHCWISFTS